MMRRALVLAAALLCAAPPAHADSATIRVTCIPWKIALEGVEKRYGEKPVSRAQVGPENIMVITASPDGATFSVWIVDVTGNACMAVAGRDYEPGTLSSELRGAL